MIEEIKNNFNKSQKILIISPKYEKTIVSLIEITLEFYKKYNISHALDYCFDYNIFISHENEEFIKKIKNKIKKKWGYDLDTDKIIRKIQFEKLIRKEFDWIFLENQFTNLKISEPQLLTIDKIIKKIPKDPLSETIIKSIDLLSEEGKLIITNGERLISDKTLTNLRRFLMTNQKLKINGNCIIIEKQKTPEIVINDVKINKKILESNKWLRFDIDVNLNHFFKGKTLGDFTKNKTTINLKSPNYFIKNNDNGNIIEKWKYEILEKDGYRWAQITRDIPRFFQIPHPYYKPFLMKSDKILWEEKNNYIFWDDDGEVLRTHQKDISLNEVENLLKMKGIVWHDWDFRFFDENSLIDHQCNAQTIKENINPEELYFILGWTITGSFKKIVNGFLQVDKLNNESFKKMPYPSWVTNDKKQEIINLVREIIENKMEVSTKKVRKIERLFGKKTN